MGKEREKRKRERERERKERRGTEEWREVESIFLVVDQVNAYLDRCLSESK